jgi:hypothetical protein
MSLGLTSPSWGQLGHMIRFKVLIDFESFLKGPVWPLVARPRNAQSWFEFVVILGLAQCLVLILGNRGTSVLLLLVS